MGLSVLIGMGGIGIVRRKLLLRISATVADRDRGRIDTSSVKADNRPATMFLTKSVARNDNV